MAEEFAFQHQLTSSCDTLPGVRRHTDSRWGCGLECRDGGDLNRPAECCSTGERGLLRPPGRLDWARGAREVDRSRPASCSRPCAIRSSLTTIHLHHTSSRYGIMGWHRSSACSLEPAVWPVHRLEGTKRVGYPARPLLRGVRPGLVLGTWQCFPSVEFSEAHGPWLKRCCQTGSS